MPAIFLRKIIFTSRIRKLRNKRLVRDHAAKGVDGTKLFAGSYQGGEKVAILPSAMAKAAVEEAHRHNKPVFANPQNLDGVNVTLESGVDVLAHTVPQSPPWTRDFVLKPANIALIPTLTLFDFEARYLEEIEYEVDLVGG